MAEAETKGDDLATYAYHAPYELQLMLLGGVLFRPALLERLEPDDFQDVEIREVIRTLKDDSKPIEVRRRAAAEFVGVRGVDLNLRETKSVVDGLVARVKLNAKLAKAVGYVNAMVGHLSRGGSASAETFVSLLAKAGKELETGE